MLWGSKEVSSEWGADDDETGLLCVYKGFDLFVL